MDFSADDLSPYLVPISFKYYLSTIYLVGRMVLLDTFSQNYKARNVVALTSNLLMCNCRVVIFVIKSI